MENNADLVFDMLIAQENEIKILDTILTLGSAAGTPLSEVNRRVTRLADLRERFNAILDGMSFETFRAFHIYRTDARAA